MNPFTDGVVESPGVPQSLGVLAKRQKQIFTLTSKSFPVKYYFCNAFGHCDVSVCSFVPSFFLYSSRDSYSAFPYDLDHAWRNMRKLDSTMGPAAQSRVGLSPANLKSFLETGRCFSDIL